MGEKASEKKTLNHLARIKELLALKFSLWLIKAKSFPLTSRLKNISFPDVKQWSTHPNLKIYMWKGIAGIALLITLHGLYTFYAHYSDKAANAIDGGQRVVIDLPGGEITARQKKTPDTDAIENEDLADKNAADASVSEKAKAEVTPAEDFIGPPAPSVEQAAGVDPEAPRATTDISKIASAADIEDVRPRIVLIITGMGLSRSTTENALSLPAQVAMSFSPYANDVQGWTTRAHDLGYELLMDAPLEPVGYPDSDPGPYGLVVGAENAVNINQLRTVLGLTNMPLLGFVAPLEEQFTYEENKIVPVLEMLRKNNLLFIYTNRPRNYFLPQTAKNSNLAIVAHDLLIDDTPSPEGLTERLKEAEDIAKDKGYAVLLAHPYPVTVKELHKWLKKFNEKGLVLIPLSKLSTVK